MILSIEHKKIEPDVLVLEFNGRITMGSDSQKIEWGLAQLLKENHKKVIFDLTEVCFVDKLGRWNPRFFSANPAITLPGNNGRLSSVALR
jgi:hypothetical protein